MADRDGHRQPVEVGAHAFGAAPKLSPMQEWLGKHRSTASLARLVQIPLIGALLIVSAFAAWEWRSGAGGHTAPNVGSDLPRLISRIEADQHRVLRGLELAEPHIAPETARDLDRLNTTLREFNAQWRSLAMPVPLEMAKSRVNALQDLENTAYDVTRVLATGAPPTQASREELIARLSQSSMSITVLANAIHGAHQAHHSGLLRNLNSVQAFATAILLFAGLLVTAIMIETRSLRGLARNSKQIAERARSADRAKSRFLTMMNHELRTPMNGIMGLLALLQQSGMTSRQTRLLDQAERSGRSMSYLLGDVLDYSELQSESLQLVSEPFEISALAKATRSQITEFAEGRALDISVTTATPAPDRVLGDAERVRQALRHILKFLIDVVETSKIDITLRHNRATLLVEIAVPPPGQSQSGWQPEVVLGSAATDRGSFASDAIGPAIARGLIACMGGALSVDRPEEECVLITLDIPAKAVAKQADLARLETQWETTNTLASALLSRHGWQLWDEDKDENLVKLVIAETGGRDEMALAGRLRVQHPNARLIALGDPRQPHLFDATCEDASAMDLFLSAIDQNPALSRLAS